MNLDRLKIIMDLSKRYYIKFINFLKSLDPKVKVVSFRISNICSDSKCSHNLRVAMQRAAALGIVKRRRSGIYLVKPEDIPHLVKIVEETMNRPRVRQRTENAMVLITFNITKEMVETLDGLIDQGVFKSRAEAVRKALEELLKRYR